MPVTINGSGPIAGATTVNGLTLPTDSLQSGMVLINKTDFSAVSTVSVNGCFTSTYDNYRIVISDVIGSGSNMTYLRLRAAGADSTGSIYSTQGYSASTGGGAVLNQIVAFWPLGYAATIGRCSANFEIFGAFKAQTTVVNGQVTARYGAAGNQTDQFGGTHDAATSYDGFSFYPAAGTMTGTIRVYGYRNS